MSEFVLDHGSREASQRFAKLDAFTQGYVATAFWLANDWSDMDESENPNEHPDWSLVDLSEGGWKQAEDECREFQESFASLLAEADLLGYDAERAGTDFFLTRNHHGAGFWDRGLGDVGNRLSEMAHAYGETDLYKGDDGQLYLS